MGLGLFKVGIWWCLVRMAVTCRTRSLKPHL